MSTINVVVVGATGATGEALIEALDESEFTSGDLYLAASEASLGETGLYKKRPVMVENLADFDFSQVQLAFFAVPEEVSRDYADQAISAGCQVIDLSCCFRNEESVPLVVSGVNSEVLEEDNYDLVALPDSLTVDLSQVLKPIHGNSEIVRINVATYQAVSSAGKKGATELARQTSNLLNGLPVEPELFAQQIAFNILPEVGELDESGHSSAELGLVNDMRRVMADDTLAISATCVQVPVFYGSCQAVSIETRYPLAIDELVSVLRDVEGLDVSTGNAQRNYPVPLAVIDKAAEACSVGRIRTSIGIENGIDLWIVSDSVRKSAANNAIGVAKLLLKSSL